MYLCTLFNRLINDRTVLFAVIWANKIVNEGLEKLVFGSYLNRNFIDWSKISDFSKLSFENLKDNEGDNGMNGNDIHTTGYDDILVVDKNFLSLAYS